MFTKMEISWISHHQPYHPHSRYPPPPPQKKNTSLPTLGTFHPPPHLISVIGSILASRCSCHSANSVAIDIYKIINGSQATVQLCVLHSPPTLSLLLPFLPLSHSTTAHTPSQLVSHTLHPSNWRRPHSTTASVAYTPPQLVSPTLHHSWRRPHSATTGVAHTPPQLASPTLCHSWCRPHSTTAGVASQLNCFDHTCSNDNIIRQLAHTLPSATT